MPRLFVAIDVPEPIRALLVPLKREQPGVKWERIENTHITLRFIGDFEDVEAIKSALGAINAASFELALNGVGQFPPKRAARVIWAGLHPVQEISALAAQIDRAVVSAGVEPEDRTFSPHLTLARIKDAPPSFARAFLADHASLASAQFRVDHFHLYQSELSSKGAVHTVLASFLLS